MKHSARWIALTVALVVAVIGVVLATQVGTDPRADTTTSQLVGKPAPELRLHDLEGNPVDASTLAGKAVIVNFWNSWCVPCQQELPALKSFAARHRDDPDVAIVGIVRDDTQRAAGQYAKAEGIDWIIAIDPGSRAALDFGTRGQPETFAISTDGVVAGAQIGPASASSLEQMLAAARGQAG
jgi:cytochrome c biogenesis protein CcmG, thiol:disulfide interchange protein DsbE